MEIQSIEEEEGRGINVDLMEAHNYCISKLEEHGLGDKVDFTLSDNNHVDIETKGYFARPHQCTTDDCPIPSHSKPIVAVEINWAKLNGEGFLHDVITHEIAHALHYESCLARGDEFPRDDHGDEFHSLWQRSIGRLTYPLAMAGSPNARWIAYCPRPECSYISWTQTLNPRWDDKADGWNMGSCPRCRKSSDSRHSVLYWVRSLYIEESIITPEFRAMEVPGMIWRPRLSPALERSMPPFHEYSDIGIEQEHPSFTIDYLGMSGPDLLREHIENMGRKYRSGRIGKN